MKSENQIHTKFLLRIAHAQHIVHDSDGRVYMN